MQVNPPAQGIVTNWPLEHCAKAPLMQAFSPEVHGDAAESVWNLAFNACASFPFWNENAARLSGMGLATAARAKARRGKNAEVVNILWDWLSKVNVEGDQARTSDDEDEDEAQKSNQARRRVNGRLEKLKDLHFQ